MDAVVNMFQRAPAGMVMQVVGASPWSYTNSSVGLQLVTVTGGAVSLISINTGAGLLPVVGIAGTFLLFPGNVLQITYIVTAPTVGMVQL